VYNDSSIILKLLPTVSLHGGQKYLQVYPLQVSIARPIYFIKYVLNISVANMAAKKNSRLYIVHLYLEFITWNKESEL
jgi:hypothetical protein